MSETSFDRRRFFALSGAGLLGCGHSAILACPEPPPQGTWSNAVGSLPPLRPDIVAYPSSTKGVVELVRAAEANQQRVRMTGSGHSFSDVAFNDGVLLLPQRLASPLTLDRARLKGKHAGDRHLVRVQGGMTIRELNALLDSKRLALENLGGYDAQTITGVAMTATHGSGRSYGPIVSQIASLQLVTTGGEVRQIEPTNGITDPARFPGVLEEDPSVPLKLVQDDDEFYAVSVSMGSMGVVTAVVLRTVDKFWLKEVRTHTQWSLLAAPGGYIDLLTRAQPPQGGPEHVEIYVNPYATRSGDHQCILTERYRLAAEPRPTGESRRRGLLGDGALFNDSRLRKLAERELRLALDRAKLPALEAILTDMLLTQKDPNFTAESYKVFNLGAINRLRAYGIEMAFPIQKAVEVANAVFQRARKEYAAGRHHSVPFSLRFVKRADSYLAMQHGRDTVMLEMGVLVDARGSRALLAGYEEYFMAAFMGRPHWGLDMSVMKSWAQVEALYSEKVEASPTPGTAPTPPGGETAAQAWRRVYERLNRNGTFDGDFTDRLGISVRPRA
jgi:L-gulono-1,4-lactone dehydrogenase